MGKNAVQKLLEGHSFLNLEKQSFPVTVGQSRLLVQTTLDMQLQQYLLNVMNVSHAQHIGIVAMDPVTGKILAMVGYDKNDPENNPCLDSRFPAASIFKIVTAAGAVERFGLSPDSQLIYNGGKYTLYKSQLKDVKNKYSRIVTLERSFAESINPIFGKLGKLTLKKDVLTTYASAFGFNQELDFELPLQPSRFVATDEPYNWAELACGFNRETTLSPLHAALITAAILNDGKIPEPIIVEQIVGENSQKFYESHSAITQTAIKTETTEIIRRLMEATVNSGTSKKTFRGYTKDQTLSRLIIGGKTGSINNKSHDARIDWFVGFAQERNGDEKIIISVVVAHENYIGVRAGSYAKMAIASHFQHYFTQKEKMKEKVLTDKHKENGENERKNS
ncbi:MAG: penicillin-binding transpeptidase domain-containing protein [Desulfobacterales bacterium]